MSRGLMDWRVIRRRDARPVASNGHYSDCRGGRVRDHHLRRVCVRRHVLLRSPVDSCRTAACRRRGAGPVFRVGHDAVPTTARNRPSGALVGLGATYARRVGALGNTFSRRAVASNFVNGVLRRLECRETTGGVLAWVLDVGDRVGCQPGAAGAMQPAGPLLQTGSTY